MVQNTEYFVPKVILVTGGAGFIGSHVAVCLTRKYPQYKVIVFDKLDYCGTQKNLASLMDAPNFKFIKGDLQSGDLLNYILRRENVDTVLHFAAQTHVDNSFGNSLAFTVNNTYGTHVLLEACRMFGGIRRFVNVSTDEVYGESSYGKDKGVGEDSTLEPTNPYSAAKAGAEMIAKAYLTSYKLPVITTRGNNVYGPNQFPEKSIPKFTLLAARGEDLPVHGDGLATRSYLYIDDVTEAFDIILHKGVVGEVYNIGSQRERTVLSVAADILRIFGLPESKIVHVRDRAFNDRRYFVCDKKLAKLGWREKTDWKQGLQRTVEWYTQYGFRDFWDNEAVEASLDAHPSYFGTHNALQEPAAYDA
ncbi:NAD(P)-binding protein [Coccomyxa subellipsoidea C-169]|uniref:NAD(P)-binding protein n=1 Tax=Coccomyxa subellipsoidea (strain C-169) TaxID=574566 RepID=I0YPI1_COCSC|nr:NAD(P)-binding protein [Coccomyxa subellipsoidea C-169]EIE20300.1 NAD(P)-binding protein [Coccomyxa subellipsoidea C-169]|eukprot:XP_005644844.1 NAD(P)-binding protein [Coccomyxa subellipsoidea C-169]